MFHFYTLWKRQETRGVEIIEVWRYIIEVSMFSRGIEKILIFS